MPTSIAFNKLIILITIIGVFSPVAFELACITIATLLIIIQRKKMPSILNLILIFSIVLGYSLIISFLNDYKIHKQLQQTLLLIIFFSFYKIIFSYLRNNIEELFIQYIKIAFIISILGLLQFIFYFLTGSDILFFTSDSVMIIISRVIRVSSVLNEPGNLAALLLPVLVFYFYTQPNEQLKGGFIFSKLYFVVFLTTFMLTFSSAGYFILIIFILWKYITSKNIFITSLVLILISVIILPSKRIPTILSSDNRFFMMMEDTFTGIRGLEISEIEKLNLSSYALLSNLDVAINAPNRIFGTGLGTHEYSYFRLYTSNLSAFGQNAQDGYSIFVRVLSEFGYFGVIILFLFLFKNLNTKNRINIAVLFILLQLILRGGHYTAYGTIFFFYLYYKTNKSNTKIETLLG